MRSSSDWLATLCFMIAAALLSAGYANSTTWLVLPGVSTALLLWWAFQRKGWQWLPAVLLVFDVIAAAGGALLAKNPAWMVAGAAAALVGWELTEHCTYRPGPGTRITYSFSEPTYFRLLTVAVVLGLIVAEGGLFLQVSVPFWGVFLSGLLILFSLYRFYQTLNRG